MTTEQHRQRHIILHGQLDELVADWLSVTECLPSEATVMSLMVWSHAQTKHPTPRPGVNEQ